MFFWLLDKLNKHQYKRLYPKYLSWLGIVINKENYKNTWISPTVFFDSSKYGYIQLGKDITVSFDVVFLVHDYSIVHATRKIGGGVNDIVYKPISVGNNCFIGARVIILPGTEIGDNTIIGSGSVVKGRIDSNSVYAGNPARRICSIADFIEKNKDLIIMEK